MSSSLVYIILVNYKGAKDCIKCLESILASIYVNYRIILVDNDSRDNSLECITNWANGKEVVTESEFEHINRLITPNFPKPLSYVVLNEGDAWQDYSKLNSLTIIKANRNEGFAAGNNIGIRFAQEDPNCDFVWLLNTDTIVFPDTLGQLLHFSNLYKKERVGILGCRLAHYQTQDVQQAFAGRFNLWTCSPQTLGEGKSIFSEDVCFKYDYVIGASMFVRTEFIREVGLLNDNYFLYFEELDWTLRGKKYSWITKVHTSVFIYHKQGSSSDNADQYRGSFSDQTHIESKVLFLRRHYPWLLFIPFLTFPLVILNRIKRGQTKRIPLLLITLLKSLIKKQKSIQFLNSNT